MSKKVLITGFNKNQCIFDYYLRQELEVVPSHYSLIRCLQDMGYEVEQRHHRLGEDLSHYDEVIVFIHSVGSFTQYLWSGLDAIYSRPDCILAFDDWQFDQIIRSFTRYRNELAGNAKSDPFRDYLFDMWKGEEDRDTVISYADRYAAAVEQVLSKQNRLLVTAFDGGDLSLLRLNWPEKNIYRYNPNPYHLNRTPENDFHRPFNLESFDEPVTEKRKEWNFASLVHNKTRSWLKKQNCEWPIKYYGGRRGEHKSPRLKEGDMCAEYSSQWGVLMPGYYHAGSGWWRARPLQVADAGSILIGEPKEMRVTHGNHHYNGKPVHEWTAADVEALDEAQRADFARFQKDMLYLEHPLDKAVQQAELRTVLEGSK